ncbi:putative Actin-binding, cofilin/tropomyosin type protein [Trachipleistophora hominis]|uniref:Putative Actin-binding, cofilin/tropomyosin type protein n=1 Tax=Trachipleistophora hominis TaxID=72359 RepID=L7JRQ6_TRAHO|nr:putative Actin-binding, cofilin/tropomyosin type protein [Trachipleistophora hominis]
MVDAMPNKMDGVYDQIAKVNRRESTYVIFHVPNVRDARFQLLAVGGSINPDASRLPTVDDIRKRFEECREEVIKYDSCYIVYDFYFNNANGASRNILILISFINDETCPTNKRFFYSSHSLELVNDIHAAKHISVNSPSEFTYDYFEEVCRSHKKN